MDAASILFVLATVGVSGGSQPVNDPRVKSVSVLQMTPDAAPVHHTAFFAGQDGWGPNTGSPPPAAAQSYDRYPAPTGMAATISAPPGVVDRTRMAVTESGNALRDGVEAGIQAANQQIQQSSGQVVDATRSAGQEFSNQFRGWAGTATQPIQPAANNAFSASPPTTSSRTQVSNPFAPTAPAASTSASAATSTRSGIAPPPWSGSPVASELAWPSDAPGQNTSPRMAAMGTVATQTDSGWTSINSAIAPPALLTPRLVNTPVAATTASAAPLQPMVGDSGPGFPVAVSANQPVDHSVLSQPQQPQPPAAAPASDNWAIGWDGNTATQPAQPATIGGRYDSNVSTSRPEAGRERDFGVTTQPVTVQSQGSQPAATPGVDPWSGKDPWGDERAKQQAGTIAQRDAGAATGPIVGNPAAGSAAAIGQPPVAMGGAPLAAGAAPAFGTATPVQGPAGDQLPWMPLLVVSLSLAGSIGANLFLGWSYMDARQKYRHLVQKTANKFRRAVAA